MPLDTSHNNQLTLVSVKINFFRLKTVFHDLQVVQIYMYINITFPPHSLGYSRARQQNSRTADKNLKTFQEENLHVID